jgi:hypothetical protein
MKTYYQFKDEKDACLMGSEKMRMDKVLRREREIE